MRTIPARFPATGGDIATAALSPMLELPLGSRLDFTERLDPVVLRHSVRLLLDLEPVLGCWLDEKLKGADWVRCADLDASVPFAVVDTTEPDAEAAAFHATPFDPKGPRLAVLLLRSAAHDTLCLRFDHVAGDGWSAKEVTHLLAETFSHLVDDPDYLPEPRTAPRPGHPDVWAALTDDQRAAAEDPPPMIGRSKWKLRTRAGGGDSFIARTLSLTPERTADIRAYAHSREATLNEGLVTAILRSAAAQYPPPGGSDLTVSISADSRRFASRAELDRVAMIATTQTVYPEYRSGETFEETLRNLAEAVQPHRDSLWGIGRNRDLDRPSAKVTRGLTGFLTTMMRATRTGGLLTMNVGAFDQQRLAFGRARPVSAVLTGPIPKFEGFPLTMSSYQGTLTLWTGFRERYASIEAVERFLAGVDEQLADAVREDR